MSQPSIRTTICDLVRPAVVSFTYRLILLTHGREGSRHSKLKVSTLFETGIVTSLYEHMLMVPRLQAHEIRREWSLPGGTLGRPKQVDLWLRPIEGGRPYFVEVGDFTAAKVHKDLDKTFKTDANGFHYFLALFRDSENDAKDPDSVIKKSIARSGNGKLDTTRVHYDKKYTGSFEIFTAPDRTEHFGYALFKRR